MAVFVLGILFLSQLGSIFVDASVVLLKDCATEQLSYSIPSSDFELFYVNGKAVEAVSFCKQLEFFYVNGCFCDTEVEEWARVGKKYCGLELSVLRSLECMHPADIASPVLSFVVEVPRRAGRKLVSQLAMTDSFTQSREKRHDGDSFPLGPKNVAMAVSGMFLLSCAFICPCFRARRKAMAHTTLPKELNSMDSASSVEVSTTSERIPQSPFRVPPSPSRFFPSPQLQRVGSVHLNMSQINKATSNFSPALKIGEGGFGSVYKAHLHDGQVVAIKRAKKEHIDSVRTEFSTEVELLAKIEHRNLVKLLGYVDKGNEHIIITEYVPNGTLREHLDGLHGKILDFNQRLEIAIDVAHALTYLHLYAEKPIIHRDVKSSNILLTESFRAKVADFGFAKLGPMDADQTHISTKVKGTAGYLDPEYLKTYQLTPKSDVYSFGILLVEILSGRRPVELKRSSDERVTVRWAFNQYNAGNTAHVLDPLMQEAVDGEILSKMFAVAFQCAAPTRSDRPTMKEVAEQLWGIRIDYLRSVRRG